MYKSESMINSMMLHSFEDNARICFCFMSNKYDLNAIKF